MRIVRFTLFTLYISTPLLFKLRHLTKMNLTSNCSTKDSSRFLRKWLQNNVKITIYDNWDINYPAASTDQSTDTGLQCTDLRLNGMFPFYLVIFRTNWVAADAHILTLCHEMATTLRRKTV